MNDIFSFDPGIIYKFVLISGDSIIDSVHLVAPIGIVLNNFIHLPTDKILYFRPLKEKPSENETPW